MWCLISMCLCFLQFFSCNWYLVSLWGREDAWYDFGFRKFTDVRFVTQDVVYPGECSMCTWEVHFSSVTQSCPTVCDPMDYSTPGFPVHHQLPELTQTHVHQVSDAIQLSHPLLSPSPPAFDLSQHQGLFQWVSSLHQVAKVLEFQFCISPSNEYHQWTKK